MKLRRYLQVHLRLLAICLIAGQAVFALNSGPQTNTSNSPGPEDLNLKRLFEEKSCFELRDAVTALSERHLASEELFYRGAVLNRFNRTALSVKSLVQFLNVADKERDKDLIRLARGLQADNYRKLFLYRQAAEVYAALMEKALEKDLPGYRNNYELWKDLGGSPGQKAIVNGDSFLTRDSRGRVGVTINGSRADLLIDTGANLSVITASFAAKLDLDFVEGMTTVRSISGGRISARMAIAKSLKLGSARFKNVVFLVFEDKDLFVKEAGFQIDGLIGFPVISALGSVSFVGKKGVVIHKEPKATGRQNLCFDGLNPLIEGFHDGRRLIFSLDTGADTTNLYPKFFRLFDENIRKNFRPTTDVSQGVSGTFETPAFLASSLALEIAGNTVNLKNIAIHTKETNENSRYFHGNIGFDVISEFDSMTINFEEMSISFP